MQRMYNLDKWSTLSGGDGLVFVNPKPRTVRLEVKSIEKSPLFVVEPDTGLVHFLALVEGRDTLEFSSNGAFQLTTQEGHVVDVYTADGDDVSMKVVDPQSFTKVVERRARNPELEIIASTMMRNMERRFEQQAYELEAMYARRAAAAELGTGDTGNALPEPAPTGSTPPPDASAGGDSGAEGSTDAP